MGKITLNDIILFISEIRRIYGDGVPTGVHTYDNIRDMAYLCAISAQDTTLGAIGVCPIDDGRWLMTLGGTELMNSQEALGVKEDISAAFGASNEYLEAVLRVLFRNIPSGAHIVMAGYSLGSMVMQQALAEKEVQRKYMIDKAIGIGCPIVEPFRRQSIVRINDVNDSVRKASLWSTFGICKNKDEEFLRDGGYKTTIGAHALSYVASPVWNTIDALGEFCGGNTITVDFDKFIHFPATME